MRNLKTCLVAAVRPGLDLKPTVRHGGQQLPLQHHDTATAGDETKKNNNKNRTREGGTQAKHTTVYTIDKKYRGGGGAGCVASTSSLPAQ